MQTSREKNIIKSKADFFLNYEKSQYYLNLLLENINTTDKPLGRTR